MTRIAGKYSGGGGRVESNMEESKRSLENRKWAKTKSREYRGPLGRRATASPCVVGKAA